MRVPGATVRHDAGGGGPPRRPRFWGARSDVGSCGVRPRGAAGRPLTCGCDGARGRGGDGGWNRGGRFKCRPPTPNPPSRPPKVVERSVLQFEIAKALEIFFWSPEGKRSLCVYTQITKNFVENSKMFENHKKIRPLT